MKKQILKRSLALGALMAFVITGSAMASEQKIKSLVSQSADSGINIADSVTLKANKLISFSDGTHDVFGILAQKGGSVILSGDKIDITAKGYAYDGIRTVYAVTDGSILLGNKNSIVNITATGNDKQNVNGLMALTKGARIHVDGKALNINITGSADSSAIIVGNHTVDDNDYSDNAQVIISENTVTHIEAAGGSGLVAMSQGLIEAKGDIYVNATDAIVARGDAVIKVNESGTKTVQLNGDMDFNYDKKTSGTKVDANVLVNLSGADSYWTGNSKVSWGTGAIPEGLENVTGIDLSISKGATWNPTYVEEADKGDVGTAVLAQNKVTLNNGNIDLTNAKNQQVKIESLAGDSGNIKVGSAENSLSITKENTATNLNVNATTEYSQELAKGDIKEGLQKVADQVVDSTTTGGGKSAADNVTMTETAVLGATSVQVDENGKIIVNTIKEEVNSSNAGISQMGSIALMAWRQENNDMNKRLGELRNSKGEHGVWVRMTRGESEFKSIKNQYNAYQLGYDEKLSTDETWTVGAALTYTDAKSSFASGSGENTHKGFAVYGSKLNEDGSFVDLIAKYARLDHEFDALGGARNGEYDTNGYSVSAEYGKRFEKGNGFWIEPQVELTYGKIGSASYKTNSGVTIAQDGMDSLVGRVGFSLGKDIKDGNVYVRASYLYDFDGETSMSFSDDKHTRTMEQDLGGGWFEVGVGTNINLSKATYLYFDVEKTYGGDVATPWQWNAGVRYSF